MQKWKAHVYRVKDIIEASRKNKLSLNAKRVKLKEKLAQENSKMDKIGNISLENKIFLEKMNNLKNKAKNLYISASEKHSVALGKVGSLDAGPRRKKSRQKGAA